MNILIAIMGAGQARRFGNDKLSAPCAGKCLGRWSLDAAVATGLPVIWIGSAMKPAFVEDMCEFRANPDAKEGLASSLRLGAKIAAERQVDWLLVMLADMPVVDDRLLRDLLAAGAPAACLHENGDPGPPALFPAAMFSALMLLTGERGAGRILRSLPGLQLLRPPLQSLIDVDTQGALRCATAILSGPDN